MKSMFQPNPQRASMTGAHKLQFTTHDSLQWWGQRRAGEGAGRRSGEGVWGERTAQWGGGG